MKHAAYQNFSWALASAYLKEADGNSCIFPAGPYLLVSLMRDNFADSCKQGLPDAFRGSVAEARALQKTLSVSPSVRNRINIYFPDSNYDQNVYRCRLLTSFGNELNPPEERDDSFIGIDSMDLNVPWKVRNVPNEQPFYSGIGAAGEHRISYVCPEISGGNFQETEDAVRVSIPISQEYHMVFAMPKKQKVSACFQDPRVLAKMLTLSPVPKEDLPMVELMLPNFRVKNHSSDLKPAFQSLGLGEMFEPIPLDAADTERAVMYIDTMEQAATVEMNHAYANAPLSAIARACTETVTPARKLCFDHPFLFAIWQTASAPLPLLIGTFQES